MRLRTRLTSAMLLLGLAVLAAALSTLYVSEKRYLLRQAASESEDGARKVAKVCEEALSSESDLVALNYIKAWLETPGAVRAVLAKKDGVVYLHSNLIAGDKSTIGKPVVEPENPRLLRFEVPVTAFRKTFGVLIAYYDRDVLEARVGAALGAMARRMLASGGLALLFGLGLAYALAAGLDRPIRELAEGARRVGTGDFTSPVGSVRDDELGALARDFDAMADKLRQFDQVKDRFLHSVSHEMRAPLAIVAGAIYNIRRVEEAGTRETVGEDIAQIEKSVERLKGFVDNILDLARLEAGRTSFAFEPVAPSAMLEEVRGQFARKAEEFKVRYIVEPPAEIAPVLADPGRIQQVLANLILNAFKFTPEGGQVSVRAENTYEGVLFSVADTGTGVPADLVPKLFVRFGLDRPVKNPRRLPSSGLGLSICKEIVDAHKGRIWAHSSGPGGSMFCFVLPRA